MKKAVAVLIMPILYLMAGTGCIVSSPLPTTIEYYNMTVNLDVLGCPWTKIEIFYVTDLGQVLLKRYTHLASSSNLDFRDRFDYQRPRKMKIVRKSLLGTSHVRFLELPVGEIELVINGQSKGLFKGESTKLATAVHYQVVLSCPK
jgi:hypothetical protein